MPNQAKWESCEYLPLILNVKVIEAKEFPNNEGKTDAYLELFFKDDLNKIRTRTMNDTMTPQWFQDFQFYIIDLNDPFIIKLWDENSVMKNSPMSQAFLDLNKFLYILYFNILIIIIGNLIDIINIILYFLFIDISIMIGMI